MEKDDFYPDIEQYLESVQNNTSVSSAGLDELIYKINAITNLGYQASAILLATIFQEIRNSILRGEQVSLQDFGKFFISDSYRGKKRYRYLKFKAANSFIKKINGSRDSK